MDKEYCDLYARVSTSEQAEEGFSLEDQEQKLRSYADAQGWIVNAFYADAGFSGAKLDRPGIQAVLDDVRDHKITRVVTYKLDRLSRSQKDTLYLIEDVFLKNGVDYVSMTESLDTGTPFGMAMIGILAVFAQLERENIKERMSNGRRMLVKDGNWRGGGGVPYGYRYLPKDKNGPGRLIIEPVEAEIVRFAYDQFIRGNSLLAVEKKILDAFPNVGKKLHHDIKWLKVLLQNQIYIGKICYKGEVYPGKHEPILTEAIFYAAQERMTSYMEQLANQERAPRSDGHMLSGLIYCGVCGSRWRFKYYKYKSKKYGEKRQGTYICKTKDNYMRKPVTAECHEKQWIAEELEEIVWNQILQLNYEDIAPKIEDVTKEIEKTQAEIDSIDYRQTKIVELFSMDIMPVSTLREEASKLRDERKLLTEKLSNLKHVYESYDPEIMKSVLSTVKQVRDYGSEEEQREVVRILISKITLGPERQVTIEWRF